MLEKEEEEGKIEKKGGNNGASSPGRSDVRKPLYIRGDGGWIISA
jgi:hypothetical protein